MKYTVAEFKIVLEHCYSTQEVQAIRGLIDSEYKLFEYSPFETLMIEKAYKRRLVKIQEG